MYSEAALELKKQGFVMHSSQEECVVYVELTGTQRLPAVLGADEAVRAQVRCLHRAELAVSAHQGTILERQTGSVAAQFPNCDKAALAALDMINRLSALPPQGGVSLGLRGGFELLTGDSEVAVARARALAVAGVPGQLLVSSEVCAALEACGRIAPGSALQRVLEYDGEEVLAFALGATQRPVLVTPPKVLEEPATGVLRLRHGERLLELTPAQPGVVLGRDIGCSIIVEDRRASRMHAKIVYRNGVFMLVDQSTNGTAFLCEGEERWLRHEAAPLTGQGSIGCGFTVKDSGTEGDLVYFDVQA